MEPRAVVVGRDRTVAAAAVGAAVVLALLAAAGAVVVVEGGAVATSARRPLQWLFVASVAGGGVAAALAARYGSGVVPAFVVAGAPALGFFLALAALDPFVPRRSIVMRLGTVVGVYVGVGTPAFLVGIAVRRLRVG
jgi:hypothetical protein